MADKIILTCLTCKEDFETDEDQNLIIVFKHGEPTCKLCLLRIEEEKSEDKEINP